MQPRGLGEHLRVEGEGRGRRKDLCLCSWRGRVYTLEASAVSALGQTLQPCIT